MPARPVEIRPDELRAVLRVAERDGTRPVALRRPAIEDPVEVEVAVPVADEYLLFVEGGRVYRTGTSFELAARRDEVIRSNLLPLEEFDPPADDRFAAMTTAVLFVELRACAEAQDPEGIGSKLGVHDAAPIVGGAEGRRHLRALLDEFDRRGV